MRGEKDSTVDIPRRSRPIGQYENLKPGSSCSETSSTLDGASKDSSDFSETESNTVVSRNPSNASDMSFTKSSTTNDEIHETDTCTYQSPYNSLSSDRSKRRSDISDKSITLNDGIKNSVQKMSSTIDSYLKDKMSSNAPSPSSTLTANSNSNTNLRNINEIVELRTSLKFDRANHMDTSNNISGFDYGDKNEYRKSEQIDLYTKKFNQGELFFSKLIF